MAGDITALPPTILAGENASAPHIMWSNRVFAEGETVALELAGACRRYTVGLARTMQLGKKPPKVAEVEKAVLEGMHAVLDTAAPGKLAEDVEAAWRMTIARYGLEKESRIGYSIGVAYPPDWGEHTISLSAAATEQSCDPVTFFTRSWACGWKAGASRSARRSSSPKPDAKPSPDALATYA